MANTFHAINVRWTWEGRGKHLSTMYKYVHTKSENEFNLPVEQLNTPPTSFLPFPMRHKFIRGSRYAHPTTMTLWRLDFG